MKKSEKEKDDDLRPEYDFRTLRLRSAGPQRKIRGGLIVRLEPDVAKAFPSSRSANEALRFLTRIAKKNIPSLHGSEKAG